MTQTPDVSGVERPARDLHPAPTAHRRSAMPSRHRSPFRPFVEGFEDRCVPTVAGGATHVVAQLAPATINFNQQIIAFCQSHRGVQVGGGECAHLANEALRIAGADFAGTNYVWGSVVTRITRG